mgnify:FL=1
MIRMTAEIEILPSNGWSINNVSITPDPQGTNVSAAIGDVVSMHKSGSNPFIFGASKLNNGEVFSSEEDYYIGKQLSNSETGAFTTPYVLTMYMAGVVVLKPINFRIIFDTYYNAYPKNITVNIYVASSDTPTETKTFVNTSPYFVFNGEKNVSLISRVEVTMSDWSMPGYPLRIQGIYTGLSIYGDRRNLLSISAPIKDRSDNEQPSYGIISNAGTLSLVDGTREIKEYARLGLLTSDLDVQLWLEDTQSKKKQSLGKFKTDKWSYDNINFEVTIDFKDEIEELQNNKTNGLQLQDEVLTFLDIYTWIINNVKNLGFNFILDNISSDLLQNINCKYTYLENGSYWEQFSKLCNLAGLHIYENTNREIIVYSDFGG